MKARAIDFLERPFDDELLLRSVRVALDRSQENAELQSERAEINARLASLTNLERDVLDGLVAGKPNKIIAFDLSISPRTVEIYRANLMTKMKAGSCQNSSAWPSSLDGEIRNRRLSPSAHAEMLRALLIHERQSAAAHTKQCFTQRD